MAQRRGHGEGSIYQRESDDRWVAVVDLGYVNGKRKRKPLYGKTRKEVAEKLKVCCGTSSKGCRLPPLDRRLGSSSTSGSTR